MLGYEVSPQNDESILFYECFQYFETTVGIGTAYTECRHEQLAVVAQYRRTSGKVCSLIHGRASVFSEKGARIAR